MKLSWDPEALDHVRTHTVLGHVDVDVFGASGRWGMVAYCDGFAVFGADEVVLARFCQAAGGRDRLRLLFRAAIEQELGSDELTRAHTERLASLADW